VTAGGVRRPLNQAGAMGPLKTAVCIAVATITMGGAERVAAQVPGVLGAEAWGGAAVGSFATTWAGLEMAPGPAWGAALSWGPSQTLGGYLAFASIGFGCDGGVCQDRQVSLTSRGVSVGARGQARMAGDPWLRAGLLLHRLEQQWTDSAGERRGATTGTAAGAELTAGLSWRIGERVAVNPGLHFGWLPTRAPDGVTENAFFAALELGLRYRISR
jgi:hypothetical protein